MTVFFAIVIVCSVGALIALPLLGGSDGSGEIAAAGGAELWTREKSIALTAIKEAEFDHATGKLSDSDYDILRNDYEERALHAMEQLDNLDAVAAGDVSGSQLAAFCSQCGHGFVGADRFCAGCGRQRA